MSAGVNAIDDLDFLLIDQPLHFIDRNIHLALTIGIDRNYLVLAGDAAALVDKVNCDLRANRACRRAVPPLMLERAVYLDKTLESQRASS
jgi:hypothetical protein